MDIMNIHVATEISSHSEMDWMNIDWGEFPEILAGDECEDIILDTDKSVNDKKANKRKTHKSVSTKLTKLAPVGRRPKLVAFPNFDKSDAMIYFPCTFARLINNGDTSALSKIMRSHTSKGFEVVLTRGHHFAVSLPRFLNLFDIAQFAQPDVMVCMHTTQVVGNQITSKLYFKYTDVPEMYAHYDSLIIDPVWKAVFAGKRKDVLTRNMGVNLLPEDRREEIFKLIDLNEKFQIYGKMELMFTIDDATKKITQFEYISRLDAICHNNQMYRTVLSQ